jgi:Big-like domain-containing protein
VTFTIDGNPLGSPVGVDASGDATSDATASLSVGSHTVVATYSGDTNFSGSSDTITQTVDRAATSTDVTSSVNPSVFGQTVTFDVTVSVTPPGAGTPSGTVQFFDGSTLLDSEPLAGVANAGTASFSTLALSVGTHAITAVYSGDGNFLGSDGSVTQTVNKAQSATTVAENGPTVQGQPVSFTASVVAVAPGSGVPTGTVRFTLNGAPQGGPVTLDANGNATSAPMTGLTPGNFRIAAIYSGSINFLPSSGSVGQVVNPGATAITLQTSPNPAAYNAPVMMTATVTIAPPAFGLPTGTVDFYDGSTLIGTGELADGESGNQATFVTSSPLNVGSHNLTAEYLGDFNFAGATSNTVAQAVAADPTATSLTSSPNPSVFESPVTLTATVTPSIANPNMPSGTVSFYDGAALLGTSVVNAASKATLSVSSLSVGSHTLSATYSGDTVFSGSTSPAVTQTVTKEPTSITTSRSGGTMIATLTSAHGPLAGQTLVFATGSTTMCTVVTNASGSAACNATAVQKVQINLNGYTVSFGGSSSYLPSGSAGH